MTILYNCKHSGDQYRITKFNDGEPESSYLCTTTECDCSAGVRPMCRHREMLPYFIAREAVGTGWWYDYDRGGWVDMRQDEEPANYNAEPTANQQAMDEFEGISQHQTTTFTYSTDEPPLPFNGVMVVDLNDPVEVHNAIAEAIGEPTKVFNGHVEKLVDSPVSKTVNPVGSIPSAAIKPYRKPNDGRRV